MNDRQQDRAPMATVVSPTALIPGSDAQIRLSVRVAERTAHNVANDCRPFAERCRELQESRAWETFFRDEPKTWERLCLGGLHKDPLFVAKILEGVAILEGQGHQGPIPEAQALGAQEIGRGKPGPGRGHKTGNDITRFHGNRGTSAAYLTARLARDRPDILARLRAGDYPSVRAAAKDAGLVKEPSPLQLVQKAWRKAKLQEREDIGAWITDQLAAMKAQRQGEDLDAQP
jgi:hypothetical protein